MVSMFLVVIIPLFAASIVFILNMRSLIRDKSYESILALADGVRYRIMEAVDAGRSVVDDVSRNQKILNFLDNDYSEEEEYFEFYNSFSPTNYHLVSPQVENIYIYSERNDLVFSSYFKHANEEIVSEEWYKTAKSSGVNIIWRVIENEDDEDGYALSCIKALRNDSGFLGVAVVVLSEKWINATIEGEQVFTILSEGAGEVFYSDYYNVAAGSTIMPYDDFFVPNLRTIKDSPFEQFSGYSGLRTFNDDNAYQIIILVPSYYANKEMNRISVVYGSYCLLLLILSILSIILFTSVFSRRIRILVSKINSVAKGNFNVEFSDNGNDEITDLYSDLGSMITDMRKLIDDNYQVRLESETFKLNQKEAEFKALASQINPHFLYNTLETIRMKAYVNKDKETADLVKKLGKFMRRCLEFKDGEVTLRSELEFTNGYLELQTARFGDRVKYSIYSEVSKDYMILPLIIQPLVENAFVHGVESNKSNGFISIKVYYKGEYVMIDVSDNGQGMDENKLRELEEKLEISDTSSGKSIGLTNVHKRIKMYHGEQYGLSVKSRPGEGTTISVKLPRYPASRLNISAEDKNEGRGKA
ncbi:MAG: sensor histidine kinase [Huintestinicola sp.]